MRTEITQGGCMRMALIQARVSRACPHSGVLSRLVFVLVAALLLGPAHQLPAGAAENGDAPDFALRSTTGETLRLSEFRGDVVLLATWAGWCQRCTEQLPDLARLEATHPDGLTVLVLSLDPDEGRAAEAAHRHGLRFLHDPDGAVARLYAPRRLPALWLMDPHGRLHGRYSGSDDAWHDDTARLTRRSLVPSASGFQTVKR